MGKVKLPFIADCEKAADEIGQFIIEQCAGKTGAVIGLSGGVDSSLVAFLAKRAFDKVRWEKYSKKLSLVGYYLPTQENTGTSERLSRVVADILEIKYEEMFLGSAVCALDVACREVTHRAIVENKFVYGNMISRMRSNALWTLAALEEDKIVLGTGNADEDFGVGYYTLGGDGLVSCSPLGMLSKRLVYIMVNYLKEVASFPQEIIERKPSAELEENQTDKDDLGYTYALVELVIEKMKEMKEHKLNADFIGLLEDNFSDFIVDNMTTKWNGKIHLAIKDILYRHQGALYKAGIVNPPKANVTLEYREVEL